MVDVHKSSSLIQEYRGERYAELGGNDREATLLPLVLTVELIQCCSPRRIVRFFKDLLIHERDVPILERLIEMCDLIRLVHIDLL